MRARGCGGRGGSRRGLETRFPRRACTARDWSGHPSGFRGRAGRVTNVLTVGIREACGTGGPRRRNAENASGLSCRCRLRRSAPFVFHRARSSTRSLAGWKPGFHAHPAVARGERGPAHLLAIHRSERPAAPVRLERRGRGSAGHFIHAKAPAVELRARSAASRRSGCMHPLPALPGGALPLYRKRGDSRPSMATGHPYPTPSFRAELETRFPGLMLVANCGRLVSIAVRHGLEKSAMPRHLLCRGAGPKRNLVIPVKGGMTTWWAGGLRHRRNVTRDRLRPATQQALRSGLLLETRFPAPSGASAEPGRMPGDPAPPPETRFPTCAAASAAPRTAAP